MLKLKKLIFTVDCFCRLFLFRILGITNIATKFEPNTMFIIRNTDHIVLQWQALQDITKFGDQI